MGMHVEKVTALYWSATGNTKKVAEMIGDRLAEMLHVSCCPVDFTSPASRQKEYVFGEGDLVVVGSPTYAGKIPNKIMPDFKARLIGNGAIAVPMITYGNRSYDNSLAELCDILEKNGFHTIAGGAFIARHSMSDIMGAGRPDAADIAEIQAFSDRIGHMIGEAEEIPAAVKVSGDAGAPYYVPLKEDGQRANFLKAKPVTDESKCDHCGACVKACPMASIDAEDVTKVPGLCIKCHACVRICPSGAKYFDDAELISHVFLLEGLCKEPKKNEVFFSL